jgi:hypothetical protein
LIFRHDYAILAMTISDNLTSNHLSSTPMSSSIPLLAPSAPPIASLLAERRFVYNHLIFMILSAAPSSDLRRQTAVFSLL